MFNRSDFLRYQQQHHPTSLQSLVSSSAAGAGGSGGVSNPGLHGPPSGRQSRQEEPVFPVFAEREEARSHQSGGIRHGSSGRGGHRQHSSSRHRRRSRDIQRRVRWALLAAFSLVLLGVIVTSSYAIDRRLAQIPQLLYAGLGLCSLGLCLIVASVSVLVTRQLQGKQCLQLQLQPQQHQQQQQQLLHRTSSAPVAVSELTGAATSNAPRRCGRRQQHSEVPIWYIGCHRDTATPYCPPVPPSYWDTTATASASASSTASVPATSAAPKPPTSSRQQAPLPPPPPPSYQEALRCLEDQSSQQQRNFQYRQQHLPQQHAGAGSFDQMSVLKWTVQSSANFANQRPPQQPSFQMFNRGQREPDTVGVRRSESSSFIGEPILV